MPMIRPVQPFARADDFAYYRKRARQEQIAAQKATCKAARDRHNQLAAMYHFRASMGSDELASGPDPIEEQILETVS